jgi:uncharacterized protein YeaO (DUF488 family)
VDKLWPRVLHKNEAGIDFWVKEMLLMTGLESGFPMIPKRGMSSENDIRENWSKKRNMYRTPWKSEGK